MESVFAGAFVDRRRTAALLQGHRRRKIQRDQRQTEQRNFRFNQSILQMLAPGNVDMIGASERVSGSESQGNSSSLLPALKLKAFNFTSQSEAV